MQDETIYEMLDKIQDKIGAAQARFSHSKKMLVESERKVKELHTKEVQYRRRIKEQQNQLANDFNRIYSNDAIKRRLERKNNFERSKKANTNESRMVFDSLTKQYAKINNEMDLESTIEPILSQPSNINIDTIEQSTDKMLAELKKLAEITQAELNENVNNNNNNNNGNESKNDILTSEICFQNDFYQKLETWKRGMQICMLYSYIFTTAFF